MARNRSCRRSRRANEQPRAGLTLIELLVVIAIVSVLVTLLLPAVQSAREAARRVQCKNNMKQLGLALHNFHDANNAIPAMDLNDRWATWAVLLLPYLEQQAIYSKWNLRQQYYVQSMEAGGNISTLLCPSQQFKFRGGATGDGGMVIPPGFRTGPPGWSDYAGVWGSSWNVGDGAFLRAINKTTGVTMNIPGTMATATIPDWKYPVNFSHLNNDGLSNTFLLGEKFVDDQTDTSVFNGDIQPGYVRVCGIGRGLVKDEPLNLSTPVTRSQRFGSAHWGICHFVMGDGRVIPINKDIDDSILHLLAKVGDGEPVPDF